MRQRWLELRLEVLATRIRMLHDKAARANGIEKIGLHGRISQLEQRRQELQSRLTELKSSGSGFRQGLKREIAKLAYDFSGALDDLFFRIDAGYRPDR